MNERYTEWHLLRDMLSLALLMTPQHAWREQYLVLQFAIFVQSEIQLAFKSISINVSSIHLVFNMQSKMLFF